MFNALQRYEMVDQKILDEALEELDSLEEEIGVGVEALRAMLIDYSDLYNLKLSIEKFGFTRALAAFINPGNTLSQVIKEIPSLEALTEDVSVQDSAVIIAGIDAALEGMITRIGETIKNVFKSFITSIKVRDGSLKTIVSRLEDYKKYIEGKSFDTEKAEKISLKAIGYKDCLTRTQDLKKMDEICKKAFDLTFPKTHEEYDKWEQSVKTILGPYLEQYNISSYGNPNNPTSYKQWENTKGTLTSHGYTKDSFGALSSVLLEGATAIKNIEDRLVDYYWERYTKIEKMIESGTVETTISTRNDVSHAKSKTSEARIMTTALAEIGHYIELLDIKRYRVGVISTLKILYKITRAYK